MRNLNGFGDDEMVNAMGCEMGQWGGRVGWIEK